MQGMWVVHLVHVLCVAQLTCYGFFHPVPNHILDKKLRIVLKYMYFVYNL